MLTIYKHVKNDTQQCSHESSPLQVKLASHSHTMTPHCFKQTHQRPLALCGLVERGIRLPETRQDKDSEWPQLSVNKTSLHL